MSSYYLKALNKETGEIESFNALDDYFGTHQYGYVAIRETGDVVYTEEEFSRLFEIIK